MKYRCQHPKHNGEQPIMPGRERFEIVGFEQDRAQGGTNHVELRHRTGVVWCATCVDREKLGAEQPGLGL